MMEDYDTFLQHRLSQLRKSEEHNKPPPSSSLIRFYGQPILPPLLSVAQREEMQRHRDAAQDAAVHRKLKDTSRMAYVQTILHSVQLRKTPTLEELLQESEINTKCSYSHNTRGVSQSDLLIGTKDCLSLSPPPERKGKDGLSFPLLTSTTHSAFITSNVTPQQSYLEGKSQQGSPPSHQSVSSGYVTDANVENASSVSGRIDAEKESDGLSSSEGAYENNMGGFFLHNSLNTITKMPDIISHPPVDGEELERGGPELSNCSNFIVVKDVCCFSLQEDSVICDHFPIEKSENSHLDTTEDGDKPLFTTALDLDRDHNSDKIEGPVSSSENSGISDNLELSQTLSSHHSPTTELHIQHAPTETADNHEEKPSEEPYRLSLQVLLKKSQEYRRQQRVLRNQTKNTKIQERTREQTRTRAEEQSLSDKENDEFPDKGAVPTEGKKTKEKRGSSVLSTETSPQKSWEIEKRIENEIDEEKANFESTGYGNTNESVEEETVFKNNKLNVSQEVTTAPKQISVLPQQQPTTETSPPQEAFYLTTCPAAFYDSIGKYHTFPSPNLCRSPVHCKSKGRLQDGEALNVANTSNREVLVDTGSNEGHKVEEINVGHKNIPAAVPSTVDLRVEGDLTYNSAKSSLHIDQLESNVSSLKVLISDLESTLTENLKSRGQTDSDTQSESSFQGIRRSPQSECGQPREDGDGNDVERDQIYGAGLRRQSLNNLRNTQLKDKRPEPSIGDTDGVSRIVQVEEAPAVKVSELRLIKTLAAERGKEKGIYKEGLTKSYRPHGGCKTSTTKHVLSATQRLRIPDVFRPTASGSASVLSDTSNRPVENGNEAAAQGLDSTHSPALNQSYDVDAPSGLWLLEGSGSDSGSKGHLVQETHLTPESVVEGQGGVSKVKRRLLMHMTEETQERSANTSSSVVRPNSSTPRASARWYDDLGRQEDKQEQLKRAHAAQIRALQEEHNRQQEELLQALAVRYRLLQSVSFPCSMSSSRLGDTLTLSTLSQTSSPLSERYRHLLFAAVKGFLVRRLLRTERVAQLVRTFRDTHQFLQALQQQSPGRGEFCSRQDLLLQERVTLQLRAARYEVHDIFFSLSAGEQMLLISWDRELARERELRRRSGHSGHPRGKSSLSTATQKSLERKRGVMIQKKAAERHKGVVMGTGHNTGFSAELPAETKRGQFRANPQRVFKNTCSSRPR